MWLPYSWWQVCLVFCSPHHSQFFKASSHVYANGQSLCVIQVNLAFKNLHPPTPTGSGLFGAPNANPYSGKSRVAGFDFPTSSLVSKQLVLLLIFELSLKFYYRINLFSIIIAVITKNEQLQLQPCLKWISTDRSQVTFQKKSSRPRSWPKPERCTVTSQRWREKARFDHGRS